MGGGGSGQWGWVVDSEGGGLTQTHPFKGVSKNHTLGVSRDLRNSFLVFFFCNQTPCMRGIPQTIPDTWNR